jgi:hypothetical protein
MGKGSVFVVRHARDSYYVVGEGDLTFDFQGRPVVRQPSTRSQLRRFRFSRLGPKGQPADPALIQELAVAMTSPAAQPDSTGPGVPAGFTYLAQFADHDLTLDKTAVALGEDVTVAELVDGRSPALDLDSLYGRGPGHPDDRKFYAGDGVKLKVGTTAAVPIDAGTNVDLTGFDLPRTGVGATRSDERTALIPDARNDENLAVAQTHVAFIRFHNRVVDRLATQGHPSALLFEHARAEVIRHYQWLLRTDFLPRVVEPSIVDEVFGKGRQFFEVGERTQGWPGVGVERGSGGPDAGRPDQAATMPIEFAVAAYRLGHSMVRDKYNWNRVFNADAPFGLATLFQLFTFTGTSGNLTPTTDIAELDDPNGGTFLRLPTNWIVDWRRLHDFSPIPDRPDLVPPFPHGTGNVTKRIDTLLVDPLADLPAGTFGGRSVGLPADSIQRNLAFRNLTRANMVQLASGQQMAEFLGVKPLDRNQILQGDGSGADLGGLSAENRDALVASTPLWFYVLREAEVNGGRLTGVGGRVVAEFFHRAMEVSSVSIVRDPTWRPTLGPDPETFRMIDLLLFGAAGSISVLNPLGD